MKEHNKTPPKWNEQETSNLTDAKFKTLVIKVLKLRERIYKLGENFNKNIENIEMEIENKELVGN